MTVLPVVPASEGAERSDVLFFSAMRLVTYDQVAAGIEDRESGGARAFSPYGSYWEPGSTSERSAPQAPQEATGSA